MGENEKAQAAPAPAAEKEDLSKKCAHTGGTLKRSKRYYRNGKFYINKNAYLAAAKKAQDDQTKKSAEEAEAKAEEASKEEVAEEKVAEEPKAEASTEKAAQEEIKEEPVAEKKAEESSEDKKE